MNDELAVPNDNLGLKYNPADFNYSLRSQPLPKPGQPLERADVKSLAEVSYRPLAWLWEQRIPWNKLTVIEGPPQSAKSLLAIELGARASRGEPFPGDSRDEIHPYQVHLVSGYDNLHDTLLPRIKRAGGIIDNFGQVSHVAAYDDDDELISRRKLSLPRDILHFEESIVDLCGDVVIVDPLTGFCRSGRDVTTTLDLLDDMASRIGIPIIATLPAKASRNPLGQWESKPDCSDAPARCVWSIVADEDEPGRWLFVPTRMTFATPADGMAFRTIDGRIAWEPLPALPMGEQDETVAWLWSMLKDGPMRSSPLQRKAREYGFSDKMLRRARRVLKVEILGEGRRENFSTTWSLPGVTSQLDTTCVASSLISSVTSAEPAGHLSGPEITGQKLPAAENVKV